MRASPIPWPRGLCGYRPIPLCHDHRQGTRAFICITFFTFRKKKRKKKRNYILYEVLSRAGLASDFKFEETRERDRRLPKFPESFVGSALGGKINARTNGNFVATFYLLLDAMGLSTYARTAKPKSDSLRGLLHVRRDPIHVSPMHAALNSHGSERIKFVLSDKFLFLLWPLVVVKFSFEFGYMNPWRVRNPRDGYLDRFLGSNFSIFQWPKNENKSGY